jgi:peroxidase
MQKAMERRRRCGNSLAVVALALVAAMLPSGEAKLSPDYYRSTCPDVEATVRAVVAKKVKETFVTVPATLRLFFHDCFVEVSHIHQCLFVQSVGGIKRIRRKPNLIPVKIFAF